MAQVCGWHIWLSKGKKINKTSLNIINSVDPAIKFTVEDNKEDGTIPFLDTIVKPEADGKISITVYRKPTHMDQYLQWNSHHHLSAKYSVINTLILTGQKQFAINLSYIQKEMEHLRTVLTHNKYPNWPWTGWRKGLPSQTGDVSNVANQSEHCRYQTHHQWSKNAKVHIVISYTQGLWESIKTDL